MGIMQWCCYGGLESLFFVWSMISISYLCEIFGVETINYISFFCKHYGFPWLFRVGLEMVSIWPEPNQSGRKPLIHTVKDTGLFDKNSNNTCANRVPLCYYLFALSIARSSSHSVMGPQRIKKQTSVSHQFRCLNMLYMSGLDWLWWME